MQLAHWSSNLLDAFLTCIFDEKTVEVVKVFPQESAAKVAEVLKDIFPRRDIFMPIALGYEFKWRDDLMELGFRFSFSKNIWLLKGDSNERTFGTDPKQSFAGGSCEGSE